MTPTDNNRLLAIGYLVFGGLIALGALGMFAIPLLVTSKVPQNDHVYYQNLIVFAIMGLVLLAYGSVLLVTGFGMLQHRSWARIAGIVSAFFVVWSFPFGMTLAIFTFIFMFSDAGKQLYLNDRGYY